LNSVYTLDRLCKKVANFPTKKKQVLRNIILDTHNKDYDIPRTLPGKIVSTFDKADAAISYSMEEDTKIKYGKFYKLRYDENYYYKAI